MNNRIESLDWLRGLMAMSIMAYHLVSWLFTSLDSGSLLGRLGVYGVSIFFILSGLSMAIGYSGYIEGPRSAVFFIAQRIFRIWPLLWVCVGLAILPTALTGNGVSTIVIVANLTTTFGFFNPDAYINVGAWSIGSEMVYYALTPIILLLYDKCRAYGNVLLVASFAICLYFSGHLLSPDVPIANQWSTYINPLNNLFLYVSGIAIFYNCKDEKINPFVVFSLFVASIIFLSYYPAHGDQIEIVTGEARIWFLIASISLVVSFYKFTQYDLIPKIASIPLEKIGVATYGVYLLHPLVFKYVKFFFSGIGLSNPVVQLFSTVILTITAAFVSYYYFERKVAKIGKRLTSFGRAVPRFQEK